MKFKAIILICFLIFSSCNNHDGCINTNPIFDRFHPDAKEYKKELAHQLNRVDNSKLEYSVSGVDEHSNMLYVNVEGENLCCMMPLIVKDWTKLRDLRQMDRSRCSVVLLELKFNIVNNRNGITFEFRDVGRIEKIEAIEVVMVDTALTIHDTLTERKIQEHMESLKTNTAISTKTSQTTKHDK